MSLFFACCHFLFLTFVCCSWRTCSPASVCLCRRSAGSKTTTTAASWKTDSWVCRPFYKTWLHIRTSPTGTPLTQLALHFSSKCNCSGSTLPGCHHHVEIWAENLCPRLTRGSKSADFDDSNDPVLYISGWKLCSFYQWIIVNTVLSSSVSQWKLQTCCFRAFRDNDLTLVMVTTVWNITAIFGVIAKSLNVWPRCTFTFDGLYALLTSIDGFVGTEQTVTYSWCCLSLTAWQWESFCVWMTLLGLLTVWKRAEWVYTHLSAGLLSRWDWLQRLLQVGEDG